jgi:ABC-type sugar transport system ATPase subunit
MNEPPNLAADDTAPRGDRRLVVRGVHKRYGAVVALDGAEIDVRPAEIMALVGDNGAGKSTLIKTISGYVQPDAGDYVLAGRPVRIDSAARALELGIETVYQDLSLVDTMNAVQNVFLGREPLRQGFLGRALRLTDNSRMREQTAEILARLGAHVPSLSTPVTHLSGGQRQALAIARAVLWGRRVVILDEPTAALGVNESRHVLDVIKALRDSGVSVILISHNLEQVWRVADRVTVLRRGRTEGVRTVSDTRPDEVVSLITGGAAVASTYA